MIHVQNLTKQFGPKILFEGANAHIGYRSKIALIGPNGAGKSTLIKIILGLEFADSGSVSKARDLSIGYLSQDIPRSADRSVLEEVLRLDGRRELLKKSQADFESKSKTSMPTDAELERYGRTLEELEELDEYRLESKAKAILSGIGFKTTDFHRALTEFSGGWLMRVALARILLMQPDLLLLDEPTNHLDLESLIWLEQFLLRFRGAILVISHDTAFLNRIVSEVIEVDQRKLVSYRGNLDSFSKQKEERLKLLRAQFAGQQSKIAEIEAFVRRFGAKATKARQAQSRLKQLEKMDLIELPENQSSVRFRFPPAPHSGKEVVIAKGAELSYGEKPLFHDLSWTLMKGSRVAIVGPNGAGKTSLLKLIAQKLKPTSGDIRLGHEVHLGYYAQLQAESLNPRATIFEELQNSAPLKTISELRAIAGAFLFSGDAVDKKCSVLSGGEKARVALAKLLLTPANLLILDEPTNHLDIESRGVLLDALEDYDGTLCLVSHDRAFVAPLVDSVLEIMPGPKGSQVLHLPGTYDEYLSKVTENISEQSMASTQSEHSQKGKDSSGANRGWTQTDGTGSSPASKPSVSNNQKKSWQKELQSLEENISKLEAELAEIQVLMSDEKTYAEKGKASQLIERQVSTTSELEKSLSRWEEVSTLLTQNS